MNEAVQSWASSHEGYHFYIASDNIAAVHMTNTLATRHSLAAKILRNMADTALKYNVSITAFHIEGSINHIPDSISRLHAPGQLLRLSSLLCTYYHPNVHPTYFLPNHMSYASHVFLLPQLKKFHSQLYQWHQQLINHRHAFSVARGQGHSL